jgi:exonuclease III
MSVVALNVNGLNSLIKTRRVADWINDQDPLICCLEETCPSGKDKHRLKAKGWTKIL